MTIFIILLVGIIFVLVGRPTVPTVITPNYLNSELVKRRSSRATNIVFLVAFSILIIAGIGHIGLLDICILAFFTIRHKRIKSDIASLEDQLSFLGTTK